MSVNINIQGTIIPFPSSGESPNWAPAIVEFAQAVEGAIASAVGTYDIPPQSYTITADINSNIDLPNLTFPPSNVRGATIYYALNRTNTGGNIQNEYGKIQIVYNGSTWDASRDAQGRVLSTTGDSLVTFVVNPTGQVSFSSIALGGTFTSGKITYYAKSLES